MKQNMDPDGRKSTAHRDLILIVGLAVIVFVLSEVFDVFERYVETLYGQRSKVQ